MIDILYEDNHLIAVNKVAGELVQGDKTGDAPLADKIKAYLKKKYNKPGAVYLGVIHRLDRPTSGVVLFARTSKALTRLNQQFKERRAHKTYWAIVNQGIKPPAGTLTHWLKRNPKMNKSFAHEHEVQESKKSILHYKKIFDLDRYSILEIVLETGRHHQIRSQLTHIGFPIKGDLKYGAKRSNPDASIDLHARTLTIEHPTKKNSIQITAPTPAKPQWNFEPYD
ncbi:MAG: RluA family pseudouridine synthase [Flavobacteriaceae bacterium]